ncbi:hypothetical protein ACFRH9_17465 [Peribacillus butanolivorans]|uniref:hypothetical protein n=1 Tax=Peribacillus butanolivorans TaxID=421767 RepID=UPI00366B3C9E
MNPVIGLDVAKGESQVQSFLDKKKPYKKSFKVTHKLEGLTRAGSIYGRIHNKIYIRIQGMIHAY